ncbi:MAG TPA: hypothetical protein VL403_16100, partial [Candidatus Kryptonia bacterium]|nr:hypothetical protein [Candidatus Kryptonia bacterium]
LHLSNLALVYADSGLLDAAGAASEAALARAEVVGTPFNRAYAAHLAAQFHATVRDVASASRFADEAIRLSAEYAFPVQHAGASMARGWGCVRSGDLAGGLAELRGGMAAYAATGQCAGKAFFYMLLIESLLAAGEDAEARAAIDEAFAHTARTGEHFYDPELFRLQAECRVRTGTATDRAIALEEIRRAAALARERGAKLFELRAAISAVRLQRSTAATSTARRYLDAVLSGFSDGCAAIDLVEARALLASSASDSTS